MADGRLGKMPGKVDGSLCNSCGNFADGITTAQEIYMNLRPDIPKMHVRNEPTRFPFESAHSTINCSEPLPFGSLFHDQIHKDLVSLKHRTTYNRVEVCDCCGFYFFWRQMHLLCLCVVHRSLRAMFLHQVSKQSLIIASLKVCSCAWRYRRYRNLLTVCSSSHALQLTNSNHHSLGQSRRASPFWNHLSIISYMNIVFPKL